MLQSVVYNGQKLDLSANPDLLFQIMLTLTNLEEQISSIAKRLYNLEKEVKKTPYFVKKKG